MTRLQEWEHHRQDTNSWSRRGHELSEQEMFACLTRTDSRDESDSPCEPYSAPLPLLLHTVHHQHHQDYHLRRSLRGSLIQVQIQRRALGYSADMCSNNRTSQQ